MKIFREMEQMSPEWFEAKRGIPSASSADKIVTPGGKLSAQSVGYMNKLLAERAGFADEPMEPTEWMIRGIELEAEARALFEFEYDLTVDKVGWIVNDQMTAGCSPDGLCTMRSVKVGFEVKCPKASTHIGYLRNGVLPPYYAPQVHFSLAVTGLKDWYFMSYYPGLDPLIVLVTRDAYTDKIAKAVDEFTELLEAEAKRLNIK